MKAGRTDNFGYRVLEGGGNNGRGYFPNKYGFLHQVGFMPALYIDILKTWAEIHDVKSTPLGKHDVREAIIWNNKSITAQEANLYTGKAGLRIKDLLEEDGKLL